MIKPIGATAQYIAAYDPDTDEEFTLDDLVARANALEKQAERLYVLGDAVTTDRDAKDKRIAELEAERANVEAALYKLFPGGFDELVAARARVKELVAEVAQLERFIQSPEATAPRGPLKTNAELDAEFTKMFAPKNANDRLVDCFRELVDLQLFGYPPNSVEALDNAIAALEGVVARLLVTRAA